MQIIVTGTTASTNLSINWPAKLYGVNYNVSPYVADGYGTNSPSNGKNWYANTEYTDEHGPFTAGIFSAAKDNGIGIAGVVPEVTIIPIKTFTEANGVLHQITLFCFSIREAIDSRYRFHPWRGAENRSRLAL